MTLAESADKAARMKYDAGAALEQAEREFIRADTNLTKARTEYASASAASDAAMKNLIAGGETR